MTAVVTLNKVKERVKLVQSCTQSVTLIGIIGLSRSTYECSGFRLDLMVTLVTEDTTKVWTLWVIVHIHRGRMVEVILLITLNRGHESITSNIHTPCERYSLRHGVNSDSGTITTRFNICIAASHIVFLTVVEDHLNGSREVVEVEMYGNILIIRRELRRELIGIRIEIEIFDRIRILTWGQENLRVSGFVSSNGDSLCISLITSCFDRNGICTWSEVVIDEDTVVVMVGGIVLLVFELTFDIPIAVGTNDLATRVG